MLVKNAAILIWKGGKVDEPWTRAKLGPWRSAPACPALFRKKKHNPLVINKNEVGWQSGRMHRSWKPESFHEDRGFESHPHRWKKVEIGVGSPKNRSIRKGSGGSAPEAHPSLRLTGASGGESHPFRSKYFIKICQNKATYNQTLLGKYPSLSNINAR